METVTISKTEYADLLLRDFELSLLEQGGVNNWEWFGESITDEYIAATELTENEIIEKYGNILSN